MYIYLGFWEIKPFVGHVTAISITGLYEGAIWLSGGHHVLARDRRDNGTRVNLDLFGQDFGLIYHAEYV